MFDQLWEESPMSQKMREQYRIQGLQQGHQEGLQQGLQQGRQEGLQELRNLLVEMVQQQYPDLANLAQQRANYLDKPGQLKSLIQQVTFAPNADVVRQLLESDTKM